MSSNGRSAVELQSNRSCNHRPRVSVPPQLQANDCLERLISEMKKSAQRDANTARAGCIKVRTPPARPLSQTHRQDRLQYTAPQLASAKCNDPKRGDLGCQIYSLANVSDIKTNREDIERHRTEFIII